MGAVSPPAAALSLFALIFLNMLGFGIVVPLLPVYGKAFDAPAWQIALIFSAFSVGTFFGEPYWGRLSDKYGRKPLLISTIVANGLCYLALAFAPNAWMAIFIGWPAACSPATARSSRATSPTSRLPRSAPAP